MVVVKKDTEIINFDKAMKEVSEIKDLTTNQLVNHAVVIALKHLKEKSVSVDFDFKLFVEIIGEFGSDKELLKKILAGKDLSWENDDTEIIPKCRSEALLSDEQNNIILHK